MMDVLGRALRLLGGETRVIGGQSFVFCGERGRAPVHGGGEGYAVEVRNETASTSWMLKINRKASVERRQRMKVIASLSLHDLGLPAFAAAPRSVFHDVIAVSQSLGISRENTVVDREEIVIEGSLSSKVDGKPLTDLFWEGWDPPLPARIWLAWNLCHAVGVLEAAGMAHGDIAPRNVIIATPHEKEPTLHLIDFDGYYHRAIPAIPVTEDSGGRGRGTDGYRSRAFRAKNSVVNTDRVAMAALAYELIALRPGDYDKLERDTLIHQEEIDEGKPVQLPYFIVQRWPEGYDLLAKAFRVDKPCTEAPSPSDFCQKLEALARQAPRITIRHGSTERGVRLGGVGKSFEAVDSRLAWLHYKRDDSGVILYGTAKGMVFFRRNGEMKRLPTTFSIEIQTNDYLKYEEFHFLVE